MFLSRAMLRKEEKRMQVMGQIEVRRGVHYASALGSCASESLVAPKTKGEESEIWFRSHENGVLLQERVGAVR